MTNTKDTTMKDLDEATMWRAVIERDARCDGRFVYAVQTTGVYCRPSCPSRRPLRRNALFFPDVESAQDAGFRACQRCRPGEARASDERFVAVCRHIEDHLEEPDALSLDRLASMLGLSAGHFQRVFTRALGVSPREYANAARRRLLRGQLRAAASVTDAIYRAGFGGASRVYEDVASYLGMTPRSYRRHGAGQSIGYAIASTRWGRLLMAATDRGVCFVALGDDDQALADELKVEFRRARIAPMDDAVRTEFDAWVAAIVDHLEGNEPRVRLPLDVQGTAFQFRVWKALCEIPRGTTTTYARLAEFLGDPKATRAVARACATNPVALVVPCHRVLRGDGSLAGYRWGLERKRTLIEVEQTTLHGASSPRHKRNKA